MKFSSRKELLLSADAELERMRKLAGITESKTQITEAVGNISDLNDTISYFEEIKTATNELCVAMIKALNASIAKPMNNSLQYRVIATFGIYSGKLRDIDASFQPWQEYWQEGSPYDPPSRKNFPNSTESFAKKAPRNLKYFQNLQKAMNTLCDNVLKSLNELKAKISTAKRSDKEKPKQVFKRYIDLLDDSGFDRWEEWCLNRGPVFKF